MWPTNQCRGNVTITFNGEIYNFKTLRSELEKKGCKFKTNSDTEVILNCYIHWGIDKLLEKADGMFAIAIYDEKNLFYMCRDRFGKKPLYYLYSSYGLILARI